MIRVHVRPKNSQETEAEHLCMIPEAIILGRKNETESLFSHWWALPSLLLRFSGRSTMMWRAH